MNKVAVANIFWIIAVAIVGYYVATQTGIDFKGLFAITPVGTQEDLYYNNYFPAFSPSERTQGFCDAPQGGAQVVYRQDQDVQSGFLVEWFAFNVDGDPELEVFERGIGSTTNVCDRAFDPDWLSVHPDAVRYERPNGGKIVLVNNDYYLCYSSDNNGPRFNDPIEGTNQQNSPQIIFNDEREDIEGQQQTVQKYRERDGWIVLEDCGSPDPNPQQIEQCLAQEDPIYGFNDEIYTVRCGGACRPEFSYCDPNEILNLCSTDGSQVIVEDCRPGQCNENLGVCECLEGATQCQGNGNVYECVQGQWTFEEDCIAQGEECTPDPINTNLAYCAEECPEPGAHACFDNTEYECVAVTEERYRCISNHNQGCIGFPCIDECQIALFQPECYGLYKAWCEVKVAPNEFHSVLECQYPEGANNRCNPQGTQCNPECDFVEPVCRGNDVWRCVSGSLEPLEICQEDLECVDRDGSGPNPAQCKECTPDSEWCANSNQKYVCNSWGDGKTLTSCGLGCNENRENVYPNVCNPECNPETYGQECQGNMRTECNINTGFIDSIPPICESDCEVIQGQATCTGGCDLGETRCNYDNTVTEICVGSTQGNTFEELEMCGTLGCTTSPPNCPGPSCASCDSCEPGDTKCDDTFENILVCSSQGDEWQQSTSCVDVCEENGPVGPDHASCRAICPPDELFCYDSETLRLCGSDGQTSSNPEVCGLSCISGVCNTIDFDLNQASFIFQDDLTIPITLVNDFSREDLTNEELGKIDSLTATITDEDCLVEQTIPIGLNPGRDISVNFNNVGNLISTGSYALKLETSFENGAEEINCHMITLTSDVELNLLSTSIQYINKLSSYNIETSPEVTSLDFEWKLNNETKDPSLISAISPSVGKWEITINTLETGRIDLTIIPKVGGEALTPVKLDLEYKTPFIKSVSNIPTSQKPGTRQLIISTYNPQNEKENVDVFNGIVTPPDGTAQNIEFLRVSTGTYSHSYDFITEGPYTFSLLPEKGGWDTMPNQVTVTISQSGAPGGLGSGIFGGGTLFTGGNIIAIALAIGIILFFVFKGRGGRRAIRR